MVSVCLHTHMYSNYFMEICDYIDSRLSRSFRKVKFDSFSSSAPSIMMPQSSMDPDPHSTQVSHTRSPSLLRLNLLLIPKVSILSEQMKFYFSHVTQPLFESCMNWVYDPAPPASRRATVDCSDTPVNSSDTPVHTSDTPASVIISAFSGAPLASPHPKKSRRRRNRRSANENSAPRSAAPVTPDERWANKNSASQRATQPQSAASDPIRMMSTPVYQDQSFHSSHLPQPPVPATNKNAAFQFGLDRCRFPGLYKLAHPDPRQDLTANPSRVNNSGSGFSPPSLLQPCTKPFSGLPARHQMTCPTQEAGETIRERPGVVYPLLPRAQHPDTRVVIEAALPEAAALDRRAQPPTVLEIGDTSLPQQASSLRRRSSRRQSRKRCRNRSTGVYRPPKRSPPHGRWCE